MHVECSLRGLERPLIGCMHVVGKQARGIEECEYFHIEQFLNHRAGNY